MFVGREQEISTLLAGLEDAIGGLGRLFLLAGEPGIGKTRTAEHLAMHAKRRGLTVLFGRCHEGEGAPAFWPWVQILRGYLQGREPALLEAEMGLGASDIAHLVPEVGEHVGGIRPVAEQDTEQARFRLFDAITTFFRNASSVRPLVLVLDDLHWADKPSLLLLQFLSREIADAKLFVLATYRDVDVAQGHPLAEVLPALRRAHSQERIRLRGLEEPDVRSLLTQLGGHEMPAAFTRAIHRETEGNPFFIEEMLSHLLEEGALREVDGRWVSEGTPDEIGLPEGVRDVIGRRIARLSEPCRKTLTVASVIGREFDLPVLERVIDLDREALGAALAEAETARVIAEAPRAIARYRFTHALIRETLYGEIRTAQRVMFHRQIGQTLETAHQDAIERHLPERAYHFAEAAVGGEAEKAVDYATRAGERAASQLAFEEASRHFEQALGALELRDAVDEPQRCELMLRQGEAQFGAGELERSKRTFLRIAELAERLRMGEALARAALGFGGMLYVILGATQPMDQMLGLLKKALALLGDADTPLRARVLARIAAALVVSPSQHDRRHSLARESVAMARRRQTLPRAGAGLRALGAARPRRARGAHGDRRRAHRPRPGSRLRSARVDGAGLARDRSSRGRRLRGLPQELRDLERPHPAQPRALQPVGRGDDAGRLGRLRRTLRRNREADRRRAPARPGARHPRRADHRRQPARVHPGSAGPHRHGDRAVDAARPAVPRVPRDTLWAGIRVRLLGSPRRARSNPRRARDRRLQGHSPRLFLPRCDRDARRGDLVSARREARGTALRDAPAVREPLDHDRAAQLRRRGAHARRGGDRARPSRRGAAVLRELDRDGPKDGRPALDRASRAAVRAAATAPQAARGS